MLPFFLILCGWFPPVSADEPHTIFGKTAEGWIAVLRDKSSAAALRQQAVWALGCFGPEAKTAVPDLIEALRRDQFEDLTVDALVRNGAGEDVAIPILIEKFLKLGGNQLTSSSVGDALVRIGGQAVPALINILNGSNSDMRVCAAEVLSRIGPAAQAAVPSLIRAIENRDPQQAAQTLNCSAVRALGGIGPEAKAAVPILNALLAKDALGIFGGDFDIVIALDRIGEPPVQSLLETFLRDGDWHEANELAWLGPKARAAAPTLRAALSDKRPQWRFSAAAVLAFIDPSAAESIPVLIEALNQKDQDIYVDDVPGALAHLGPKAKAALPTLIGLVKQGTANTDLLRAMVMIDPDGNECVPALISALKHSDDRVVDVAAKCLALLGPRAKESVPLLAEVVTRDFEHPWIDANGPQVSAAKALERIGATAIAALSKLAVALKHRGLDTNGAQRDCSAAAAAAHALGSFGPKAKAAVPYLVEAVKTREEKNDNCPARQAAILALGRIGPDARAAIPVLRNMIRDAGASHQYMPELLIAIYQLDPDGKELAERWLAKPVVGPGWAWDRRRVNVLGAMGRSSFEADWVTRRYLELLDSLIAEIDPRDRRLERLEGWFEMLGRFGTAGRLAIPRLNEFRKHPDPWVRMWASEALAQIVPKEKL